MQIAVIGAGYVGLVSGACFSDFGHDVVCIDKDEAKIAALKQASIPIYEPGLDDLVARNVRAGRLAFATEPGDLVGKANVVFLSVGTPSRRGDGFADLSFVHAAVQEIVPLMRPDGVLVTKSTVPVGTGDDIERVVRTLRPDTQIAVVSNPEFLREGAAITDFKHPDRIIVGTDDPRAKEVMREVYRPLYLNAAPLVFMSRATAEVTKYAANAFLATKITFINEIADLCEQVGADVSDVARGIGLDKRIGPKFLNAGPGFGGSCFPKDTLALVKSAHDHGVPMRVVETVIAVNDQRKRAMARKVVAACGGSVRGKRIAVLGLTFKPNTDDMRDAPSLSIIRALQDGGAIVAAHDPEGERHARELLSDVAYFGDPYSCAEGADATVIVTEWEAFRALDLARLRVLMKTPVLVDLRNIYPVDEVARHGFVHVGVGRAAAAQERDTDDGAAEAAQ
jgi:UDPglucose 6-dehydrogenase